MAIRGGVAPPVRAFCGGRRRGWQGTRAEKRETQAGPCFRMPELGSAHAAPTMMVAPEACAKFWIGADNKSRARGNGFYRKCGSHSHVGSQIARNRNELNTCHCQIGLVHKRDSGTFRRGRRLAFELPAQCSCSRTVSPTTWVPKRHRTGSPTMSTGPGSVTRDCLNGPLHSRRPRSRSGDQSHRLSQQQHCQQTAVRTETCLLHSHHHSSRNSLDAAISRGYRLRSEDLMSRGPDERTRSGRHARSRPGSASGRKSPPRNVWNGGRRCAHCS